MSNEKKLFNIVLIGAAGSGKGTQGEFLKTKFKALQVSAGEVMRKYMQIPDGKYTKIVKDYTDKGLLVPTEITHELIKEYVNNNVFNENNDYESIIFDGFPRQMEQLTFLDSFLENINNKVDAVVSIEISMDALVDRLSGRFSCAKCGEIYHKKTKPTKAEGICDKCGSTDFIIREDDKNTDAIKERFRIFEEKTKEVLKEYEKRNLVIHIDGTKNPLEIANELFEKLSAIKNNKNKK